MGVSTAFILDARTKNSNGEHPIKLRVTHDRISRVYSVGFFTDEKTYNKIFSNSSRGDARTIRLKLNSIEARAISIIDKMDQFNFDLFKSKLSKPGAYSRDTYKLFDDYINELKSQNRIGTSVSYKNARHSFYNFKKRLMIEDITEEFLNKYERNMLLNDKSLTTVGIYCRSLRTIYNRAIDNGVITRESYPFGKRSYVIPHGENIKLALSKTTVKNLYFLQVDTNGQDMARDMFILSYLCNGAGISDLLKLRNRDINLSDGVITFTRTKTKRTSKANRKSITIDINPQIGKILDKWGANSTNPEDHILRLLKNGLSAENEFKRIKGITSNLNRRLKTIAKKMGIASFSMYSARHTFATILKTTGAPLAFISDSMGHNSIKTTENYFASFEKEDRQEFSKPLTDFLNHEKD